jgi:hypothetical protein
MSTQRVCSPVFPNFRNPSRRRHLSVSTISRIVEVLLMLWVAFKLQGNGANLDMDMRAFQLT